MMSKLKIGGLAAAAVMLPALAACQKPAAPVDAVKEEKAILAQIDAFNAAEKAGDAERAIAIDAPDIRGYGGGPDITSPSEDLKATKAMMTDPAFQFSVKAEHTEVAKSGDMAFQTGTYEAAGTDPKSKAVTHTSGHFVAAWKKDDQGRWKLAAVSSASPPPAAGQ